MKLTPEVWKSRELDHILLRHYNAVYNQNPIFRWTKGYIVPFPKKGGLGLAKIYWVITLKSIVAMMYNALLRNRIEPKIENIHRKSQNSFRRNRSTVSEIFTIRRILEGVRAKNPTGNNIICRLHQGLRLYTQSKVGANTIRLRPTQRNRRSYNDAI